MRDLGRIVRLQIQRNSLKTGEKPTRVYDPGPLLPVERLAVGPDGALGMAPDGSWVVDVHHRSHPHTKNEDGVHGLSLGFTSHYDQMRERFGERITPGCAGENILVAAQGRFTLEHLESGVTLLDVAGRELARLDVLQVAHPCRPFSGWALGKMVDSDVLKETLQFLDDGMRGFYCQGLGAGILSVGDRVVIPGP
ncbi:MAG TPA: MOSC domain-containing protein [Gemmatimonadales bacterium]|nr:MOSC domain-containing protein [Gemmatimonadales bacterium]